MKITNIKIDEEKILNNFAVLNFGFYKSYENKKENNDYVYYSDKNIHIENTNTKITYDNTNVNIEDLYTSKIDTSGC